MPNERSAAEGFQYLSCRDNSFIIKQQLGDGWKFIGETMVFKAEKDEKYTFYLYTYKREILDRRNPEKRSVKKFSQAEIGRVLFQDLSRDFLIDLINRENKTDNKKVKKEKLK